jgi:hypothetical protein
VDAKYSMRTKMSLQSACHLEFSESVPRHCHPFSTIGQDGSDQGLPLAAQLLVFH